MTQKTNGNFEKRLGLNGLAVIIALLGLYGISCTAIKSWQIHTDDFMGVIVIGALALAISALWLLMYWFLDRIQHESVKITLFTFFLAAISYIAGKSILIWIIGNKFATITECVIFPVVLFFILFAFVFMRFHSFDELVDPFIYGGFAGTGIAFARCMTEFVQYNSLDGQFMIIELITRISVYAAICSLAGFSIYNHLNRRKTARLVLSLVAVMALFAVYYGIEEYFLSDLAYADTEILSVLVSVGFVFLLVFLVVVKIHRTLKIESSAEEFSVPKNYATVGAAIALLALFFGSAFLIRYGEYKTESFVSPNGDWTFELPYRFYEVEETEDDSIFDFAIPTGNVFYRSQSGYGKIYISYGAEKNVKAMLNIGGEYGWDVFVDYDQFITKDYRSKPVMMYQKIYYLQKGEESVLIDVFTEEKNDEEFDRAVRIVMKTLETRK